MIRFIALRGAAACFAAALLCTTAEAQLFRAYLTSDGSDANPCTLQAPCRLLPAALNAVASGGEIWMLDSANYNTATVNVSKSVSILAVPGVVGSVVALNGGPAILITAGGLAVSLRNLVIGPVAGTTPGTFGVLVTGASRLTIEDSLIANLPQAGVLASNGSTLKVTNTVLRNNADLAVRLQNGANATLSRTKMLANSNGGIQVTGNSATPTVASLNDSVVSGGTFGVNAFTTTAGAVARVAVTRSMIDQTGFALRSAIQGGGTVEVSVGSSLIVDSYWAWYQLNAGSTILTLGNNQMSGNQGSFGVLTPLPPQ